MMSQSSTSTTVSKELDHVLSISRIIAQSSHWKPALDQIVPILRQVFIFDNLVLYLPDPTSRQIEVAYARVVGRGRSIGPDINWGEAIARQAIQSKEMVVQQPPTEALVGERLELPFLLAHPLEIDDKVEGALVFIRFGGPGYNEISQQISAQVAEGIAMLLRYQAARHSLLALEAEKRQVRLQEDFVSTISHELLTPLGFIKGYTTTLLRADTSWDETNRREFLTIIDEETDRLQELIDNVLDSARLQSGTLRMEFQPVRLDALLKDVIMRSRQHHKNLQIDLSTFQSPGPIQGDPRRLAQVFENLVINAVKYAPGSPISITVTESKDSVQISFQDSGPGIPPQYLPHLFERFFRNPEQAPNIRGTGLGLYICRQIIEAHHGKISVDSYLGEGTTIQIELPYEQNSQNVGGQTLQPVKKE
jgi:signal transduction histidine kinase